MDRARLIELELPKHGNSGGIGLVLTYLNATNVLLLSVILYSVGAVEWR